MKGPLEYVGQYRWFNPSFHPSLCPYIHGEKTPPARRPHHDTSRVVNSKIPDTLTRSLFVVQNLDLDHTIKPCHWTRPFTPHFRPSDRGKLLVETVIFAW